MPTTIDSAGITFNDTSTITSANTFIAKPASPSNGEVLGYDGSTWTSTSLSASPAVSKAWACFTCRSGGVAGIVTIRKNSNISTIDLIDVAAARYKVNFITPMEDRAYSMTLGCAEAAGAANTNGIIVCESASGNTDYPTTQVSPSFAANNTSGKTQNAVKIAFGTASGALNPTEAYFQVFG